LLLAAFNLALNVVRCLSIPNVVIFLHSWALVHEAMITSTFATKPIKKNVMFLRLRILLQAARSPHSPCSPAPVPPASHTFAALPFIVYIFGGGEGAGRRRDDLNFGALVMI